MIDVSFARQSGAVRFRVIASERNTGSNDTHGMNDHDQNGNDNVKDENMEVANGAPFGWHSTLQAVDNTDMDAYGTDRNVRSNDGENKGHNSETNETNN